MAVLFPNGDKQNGRNLWSMADGVGSYQCQPAGQPAVAGAIIIVWLHTTTLRFVLMLGLVERPRRRVGRCTINTCVCPRARARAFLLTIRAHLTIVAREMILLFLIDHTNERTADCLRWLAGPTRRAPRTCVDFVQTNECVLMGGGGGGGGQIHARTPNIRTYCSRELRTVQRCV